MIGLLFSLKQTQYNAALIITGEEEFLKLPNDSPRRVVIIFAKELHYGYLGGF